MLSDAGEPPKKGLPKNGFTYSQTISPSLVTSNEATAEELVAEATKAEDEAIDLYHFTSLINRTECRLELHPAKTKIVYCKDRNRTGAYPNVQFDFLGYCFRPLRWTSTAAAASSR